MTNLTAEQRFKANHAQLQALVGTAADNHMIVDTAAIAAANSAHGESCCLRPCGETAVLTDGNNSQQC